MPFETPVGLKACPSPPTHTVFFAQPFPGKLDEGQPLAFSESAIEPSLHSAKDKFALAALIDRDSGSFDEIELFLIPLIHLDDQPRSMNGFALCWHEMFSSCSRLALPPDSIAVLPHMQCALWNDHEAMTHLYRNLLQGHGFLTASIDDLA